MSDPNEYQQLSQKLQEIVHLFYEYINNPEKTVIQPLFKSEIKKAIKMAKLMGDSIHLQMQQFERMGQDLLTETTSKEEFEKLRRQAEKLIMELKEY